MPHLAPHWPPARRLLFPRGPVARWRAVLPSAVMALVLMALALAAGWAHSETLTGRVVAVADGDTVTVLDAEHRSYKVRLSGIDAPEKKQAFGQRAQQSLSEMVHGREVRVTAQKKDRYGRVVGRLQRGEMDVNLEQLRRGLAWHYKQYEQEQAPDERERYREAEAQARTQRMGLWRDAQPVPPWVFRHPERATATP